MNWYKSFVTFLAVLFVAAYLVSLVIPCSTIMLWLYGGVGCALELIQTPIIEE